MLFDWVWRASRDLFSLQLAWLDACWPRKLPQWAALYASPIHRKVAEAAQIHKVHSELEWISLADGVSKCTGFHGVDLMHLCSEKSGLDLPK